MGSYGTATDRRAVQARCGAEHTLPLCGDRPANMKGMGRRPAIPICRAGLGFSRWFEVLSDHAIDNQVFLLNSCNGPRMRVVISCCGDLLLTWRENRDADNELAASAHPDWAMQCQSTPSTASVNSRLLVPMRDRRPRQSAATATTPSNDVQTSSRRESSVLKPEWPKSGPIPLRRRSPPTSARCRVATWPPRRPA